MVSTSLLVLGDKILTLKEKRILDCANFRHGIVMAAVEVKRTFADVEIFNYAVPSSRNDVWQSASGGASFDRTKATLAAICEALERYCAFSSSCPSKKKEDIKGKILNIGDFSFFSKLQVKSKNFPFKDAYLQDYNYTNVFSVYDNEEIWVPKVLVSFEGNSVFSTSSGLAVGGSKTSALISAVQEIIERDALMTTWNHGIKGRQIKLDEKYADMVEKLGAEAICIDVTQDWSTYPTAIVTGFISLRGKKRYSLGAACRPTWKEAVEKAFLEWCQGVSFAGQYLAMNSNLKFDSFENVKSFEDHASYYTVYPEKWKNVRLVQGKLHEMQRKDKKDFIDLLNSLKKQNIRLYYRDMTSIDLDQLGISCIRALSPDLVPIHFDQRAPFLGGTAKDVKWRYSWASDTLFPNPYPHPLG